MIKSRYGKSQVSVKAEFKTRYITSTATFAQKSHIINPNATHGVLVRNWHMSYVTFHLRSWCGGISMTTASPDWKTDGLHYDKTRTLTHQALLDVCSECVRKEASWTRWKAEQDEGRAWGKRFRSRLYE